MKKRVTLLIALLMASISYIYAQQLTITGTVTDKGLGDPVIGATILVQGTTNGTVTDMDGKFSLDVSKGDILHISYIGYQHKPSKLTEYRSVHHPVG